MVEAYSKITTGFVTQQYLLNRNKKYVCFEQYFTAGDQVNRENEDGDPVEVDTSKEVYQSYDMEQPRSMTFDEWFQENKHNDSVQSLFRGAVETDPDYPFCFKEWAKEYYEECVDI